MEDHLIILGSTHYPSKAMQHCGGPINPWNQPGNMYVLQSQDHFTPMPSAPICSTVISKDNLLSSIKGQGGNMKRDTSIYCRVAY